MFNWLFEKALKKFITKEIEKLKEIDVKEKALEYINEHKEEVIERAKDAIKKIVKSILAKIVEQIKDKVHK